jgi:hypothetical protein
MAGRSTLNSAAIVGGKITSRRAERRIGNFRLAGRVFTLAALTLALFVPVKAWAQEPTFGFTYTTDTLPKNKFEITQWSTTRFDKAQGSFRLQENLTELEYGLTNRLEMAVYADYDSTEAYHNGPFGVTTPPEPFSNDVPPPNSHYRNTRYIGATVEAIYRLWSPYEHPLGVALYQEATVGPDFFEPESKLILQKDFRDDLVVLAYNFTYAPEDRRLPPNKGCLCLSETDINSYWAASYRFIRNWSVGAEFGNEREFNSYGFSNEINSAFWFGPDIHYAGKNLSVTLTFLDQLPWAGIHADTLPGAVVDGYDFDNDFEKYRVRVKVAWYFSGGPESWLHRGQR